MRSRAWSLYQTALYLGCLEWILLAGIIAWACVGYCVTTEAAPPISIASEEAPPITGARQDAEQPTRTPPQEIAVTKDLRPLIVVYSSANCPACVRWSNWWTANQRTSPFRFAVRPAPEWVTSFPAFHFQAGDGTWRVVYGWTNIEALQAAWQQHNPRWEQGPVDQTVGAPDLQEILPVVQRFAGKSGRFTFTPDGPVDAQVKDGLTIRYASISGRYDASGPAPRIVFDQPVPSGTVTVPYTLGAWRVGYKVEAATLEPGAVAIKTDLKTVRIALED